MNLTRTHTHTYVTMGVSSEVYAEVRQKLEAAGYQHAIHGNAIDGEVLDMHGIALVAVKRQTREELERLAPGLYRIHWTEYGGSSIASVFADELGNRWLAPANWTSSALLSDHAKHIRSVELIEAAYR